MKKNILVTRPVSQGIELTQKLNQLGFNAEHIPVLEISPLQDKLSLQKIQKSFSNIKSYHGIIIVSINSAEQSLSWFEKYSYHSDQLFFFVGLSTAQFLTKYFLDLSRKKIIYPKKNMNSEGLLALPELKEESVKGKRFLLLRGMGGRELIANTLTERGATVDSIPLYQRSLPTQNMDSLQASFPLVDIVLVNSLESLQNLMTLLGENISSNQQVFSQKTLLVPSERIKQHAQSLGFQHIITADNATDDAVIQAIQAIAPS